MLTQPQSYWVSSQLKQIECARPQMWILFSWDSTGVDISSGVSYSFPTSAKEPTHTPAKYRQHVVRSCVSSKLIGYSNSCWKSDLKQKRKKMWHKLYVSDWAPFIFAHMQPREACFSYKSPTKLVNKDINLRPQGTMNVRTKLYANPLRRYFIVYVKTLTCWWC